MFSKFFTFSLSAFIALVFTGTASICLAQGNTWDTTKTDMPTSRHVHRACAVNEKIYVMGGITSVGCDFPITKVEEYDPSTDTWDPTKTDMPTPRESFGLSAVDGKIYAIGGQANNCSSYLSVVEEYDPSTDTWDPTKTDMLTPRGGLSTSVVNGKIYAIGGHNTGSGTPLTTVEEYDPVTDSWETKEPMPHARTWFSTTVVDGKIYAFPQWWGGPDSINVYDPVNDTWETIDRPELGADCSASTVNGLIYTFGGIGFMSDVWEYNPGSNTWKSMSPMPTGRADAPATEVNGKIYVIGGSTTSWPSHPASMVEEYTPPPPVGVEDPSSVPAEFLLHQNFPNPFNPNTLIKYQIPEVSFVTLKVFDVLGCEIITLVNEEKPVGNYEVEFNAIILTSGVYFYQLRAGDFVETKKMVLLK
jgi:N-acetylneuraminic acid mutarotase